MTGPFHENLVTGVTTCPVKTTTHPLDLTS